MLKRIIFIGVILLFNNVLLAQIQNFDNNILRGYWVLDKIELKEGNSENPEQTDNQIYLADQLPEIESQHPVIQTLIVEFFIPSASNEQLLIKRGGFWFEGFKLNREENFISFYNTERSEDKMQNRYTLYFPTDDQLVLIAPQVFYVNDKGIETSVQAYVYLKRSEQDQPIIY